VLNLLADKDLLRGLVIALVALGLFAPAAIRIVRRRMRNEASEPSPGLTGSTTGVGLELVEEELVAGALQPVVVHTDRIVLANAPFAALLGVPYEALVGRQLWDLVEPDYEAWVRDHIRRVIAGEQAAERYEVDIANAAGEIVRLELAGRRVSFESQPAVLYNAIAIVVEAPTAAPVRRVVPASPEAISLYETVPFTMAPTDAPPTPEEHPAALQAIPVERPDDARHTLDSLSEGVIVTTPDGGITFVNRSASELIGRPPTALIGHAFGAMVQLRDEGDQRPLADPIRQCMSSRSKVSLGRRAIVLTSVDGSSRSLDVSATPRTTPAGEVVGVVIVLRDVTELRGMARQMSYQASHDPLTGLVNRREFERRLDDKLVLAHQGVQTHVLCYLDLDGFKVVNDTSGHAAGDDMLREVAARLRSAVRDSDTVARIGGDEFAILLVGCPLHKAAQIADTVVTSIRDYRFVWKNSIFTIGIGIGIVELGRESGELEDVMTAADSACYVAKSRGRGQVHVYSARDEAAARGRGEIQWLHQLQHALKEGRFLIYTQPIVATVEDPRSGPALEVLVRLAGDQGAVIAPGEFLRAAERYRLMTLVDRWVVQHILAAMGRGAIRIPAGRSVSINISAQSLGDAEFLDFIVEGFDRSGVDPASLCFEVTEAAVVANIEHARRFIEVLHGLGCSFALDDFGSGLGSLAHLKTLPMDFLKIDGVYMRELDHDEVNRAMVTAMIELGRTLGFRLIAEQVEDEASLQTARQMGVHFVQGFAIARPEPLKVSH